MLGFVKVAAKHQLGEAGVTLEGKIVLVTGAPAMGSSNGSPGTAPV